MIFRFNSKDGRFRTDDFDPHSLDLKKLIETDLVSKLPKGVVIDSITVSKAPNEQGTPVAEFVNKPLDSLGFKNGEMFFLNYNIDELEVLLQSDLKSTVQITSSTSLNNETPKQPAVDDELDKLDGLIPRKRSSLCKHTEKGMCEYCSPLPPYDEGYQEENNIKHMSYHAYLQSLNDQTNKKESATSFIPPLEEPSYTKDPHCPNHPPNQICSKCQPSAITLQQQRFRMVDHVEISNPEIINEFINTWRKSGLQRIGIMIGKYERYDEVPLGIKARVELIYEIPQTDDIDGVVMENFDKHLELDRLSAEVGLHPVGIIFTDLTDSGLGNQTVLCKRHKDSFFLSSLEVIFAARQQLAHPNYTKWSASGKFSSKFITCCITGNIKGEIDIYSYQVSNSAEKLVESDLISASTHPNCVFINKDEDENGKRRYVPEIFYNKINEYGRQVKENAKPWFPVEYLIVSLTHGFPKDASESIQFPKVSNFPIENRQYLHEIQSLESIPAALKINKSTGEYDLNEIRGNLTNNFHLVFYLLFELDILNDNAKNFILQMLIKRVKDEEDEELKNFYKLLEDESWNTMLAIIMAS